MAKRSTSSKDEASTGPTIENRKARHDYTILDTIEAGIVLRGSEVKSIRDGKISLAEGYIRVQSPRPRKSARKTGKPGSPAPGADADAAGDAGLFMHSVNIAEYPPAGPSGSPAQHIPTRVRKLLAHQREIARLAKELQVKGTTLIPLKVYFKNGRAKVLVGVAKGRRAEDKREAIAKRDAKRDMDRALSRRR